MNTDDADAAQFEEEEEADNLEQENIISLHKNGKGGKTMLKKEEDEEVYLESEDGEEDANKANTAKNTNKKGKGL